MKILFWIATYNRICTFSENLEKALNVTTSLRVVTLPNLMHQAAGTAVAIRYGFSHNINYESFQKGIKQSNRQL